MFPVEILISPLSDDSDEGDRGDEHLRLCALTQSSTEVEPTGRENPALDILYPVIPVFPVEILLSSLSDDGDASDGGDEGLKSNPQEERTLLSIFLYPAIPVFPVEILLFL